MKKLFIFAFFVLFFVSCETKKDSTYLVGVSQCSVDNWRETANAELKMEASIYSDLQLEIRSVKDNSENQIADIEHFINEGVDLLVVSPNQSEALTPVIAKAFKAGIPVVLWDSKIDTEDYSSYVGADNVLIGRMMGEYLLNNMDFRNGKKNIIILRGNRGATTDKERYDGFFSAISSEGSRAQIQVVAEEIGDFLCEKAYERMKYALGQIPQGTSIDAIVAFNDQMAIGAYNALSESGRGDMPLILGVDVLSGPDSGIEAIKNGEISASFIYPAGGDVVVDVIRRILHGESYHRSNLLNTEIVNQRNVHVISLQRDMIEDRQGKIEVLTQQLGSSTHQVTLQRRLFIYLIALILLVLFVAVLLLVSNRSKSKLNDSLNRQNKLIQDQVQELEMQKDQLLQLSRQLEQATQAKLVFFTNISHEFRTPLTLILGPLEELLQKHNLDASERESLMIAKRNGDKLLSLINEILDFRTYENGKMKVSYSMCDYKEFIESVNSLFADIARRKQIKFTAEFSKGDYNLPMDKNKFERIYFNLLSNAIKYVQVGGSIETMVSLVEQDGRKFIRVSVFNSDSYIPKEKLTDIFQRFYKLGNDENSSGIGLALTYSLIELLGGTIDVESYEGRGTTFVVMLPVDIKDSIQTGDNSDLTYSCRQLSTLDMEDPAQSIPEDTNNEGRSTVLVVEDNADMLKYLKSIFSEDFRVVTASNGVEGLTQALKYVPKAIVSDVIMPEKDGYELCAELKSNPKTKDIPVILLTACALDDQRVKGYESGADAYIQKPFSANVLKVRIKKLLEKVDMIYKTSGAGWLIDAKENMSSESAMILDKFQRYVEEHIDEGIHMEDIAAELGLSKSKFYRKLNEVSDYSPIDMINLTRLRRAINLIVYHRKNISEAAFESGFSSLSYFSRVFYKYYKDTPKAWIKKTYGDM